MPVPTLVEGTGLTPFRQALKDLIDQYVQLETELDTLIDELENATYELESKQFLR